MSYRITLRDGRVISGAISEIDSLALDFKQFKPDPPPAPQRVVAGLHDFGGLDYMNRGQLKGFCLVHWPVSLNPAPIDFSTLAGAGIRVIARINWGYAGGTGTLPPANYKHQFINACAGTILQSKGVEWWHVGNEPNNRGEWPAGFEITPQYVVEIYNAIWARVGSVASIGPPPLDPYFGPGSNNADWWKHILGNIDGAHALFVHLKTQTNVPQTVWSTAKFTDDPLRWQYLNMRVLETYAEMVPGRFRGLPILATEVNPQFHTEARQRLGWIDETGAEWVKQSLAYLEDWNRKGRQQVIGACFYRFETADAFGLEDKARTLARIVEALR